MSNEKHRLIIEFEGEGAERHRDLLLKMLREELKPLRDGGISEATNGWWWYREETVDGDGCAYECDEPPILKEEVTEVTSCGSDTVVSTELLRYSYEMSSVDYDRLVRGEW